MPLSEEELRLLEQMERALVAEDPKLASTLRGTRMRQRARRQVILGVAGFVVGIAALMAGVVLPMVPVGIAGFLMMLGSGYLALSSWRVRESAPSQAAAPQTDPGSLRVIRGGKKAKAPKPAKAPTQGTMMERFEERWRRRRDQNGGGY